MRTGDPHIPARLPGRLHKLDGGRLAERRRRDEEREMVREIARSSYNVSAITISRLTG
jgi:hypothetical protein